MLTRTWLPVWPPSRGGSVWAPTSTKQPATTGNCHLPLVFDLTRPAKCHNPRDLIPGSSSQASVHSWSMTPLGLSGTDWDGDSPPWLGMREREDLRANDLDQDSCHKDKGKDFFSQFNSEQKSDICLDIRHYKMPCDHSIYAILYFILSVFITAKLVFTRHTFTDLANVWKKLRLKPARNW